MTIRPGQDAEAESLPSALDRVYRALARAPQAPAAADRPEARSPGYTGEPWRALERLEALFGLSSFERDLLVLCAGPSLESRFISGCAAALNDDRVTWPTFGLALTVLDDPHWSALSPARPLRYWQLVEIGRGNLLHAPLRIDERILLFLIGVPAIDERLQALARPIAAGPGPASAGGFGQLQAVSAGARHWERDPGGREPLLLIGRHRSARQGAFVGICQHSGLRPYCLDASDIPAAAFEREQFARLWTREAALTGAALYLRTEDCDSVLNISAWLELTGAPVAIEVQPGTPAEQLDGLRLHLADLSARDRKEIWTHDLGALAQQMDGYLDRIAEYFGFDEAAIHLCAAAVRDTAAASEGIDAGELGWRTCREHARRSLDTLAQRVDARACWADLVLPAPHVETLRQIAIHVRQRAVVNDQWGFAAKHARGLGLTVLFAGSSGTGKTMAAEILAAELDLDLYKVDLASVVSKYIGETEKNLRAIFNGAEQSGAILLFDEADALFGKRSEVHDSHDRYANLEISYLLQQMEAYRGVAILTTNMQHALDPAFMRRIRFIVQFPFPDPNARASIWRRIFPAATPVAELDFDQLAQLNVAGGVIRNIAMHAAFLAADDSLLVEARHILAAARTEYAKIDKPLTAAETRGLA
ncbi:MAG TPA: ATP-binding protein [Streptosporangiaceae bacterium]|nr:ATP-binding protein [Streptosporangiaceae bacterium]